MYQIKTEYILELLCNAKNYFEFLFKSIAMSLTVQKSIKIKKSVADRLNVLAKLHNRNFSNLLETIAIEFIEKTPNTETLEFMYELKQEKGSPTTLDELKNV